MFNFYNKNKRLNQTARSLYGSIVAQTRNPVFYADWRVPDELEGRFEMLVVHMSLLIHRLKGDNEQAMELGRHVSEVFIEHLDDSFREMGVGDLAVPKRIKMASEAYFGRLQSYSAGLDNNSDDELIGALGRNIAADEDWGGINIQAISDYMRRSSSILSDLELEDISKGRLSFAVPGGA